ncbi:restriction endonuclease subunit S [Actinomadura formosensis]|uniref:restriction endonuclease subunit S n=1 Tax=Actinomadura formosensis TaxID=60706 RepID=UPI003D8C7BE7
MTSHSLEFINFPSLWSKLPLWSVAPRVKEINHPTLAPLSVFLDAGVIPRDSRSDNHNHLGEDLAKYLKAEPGDLIFNKLRTWQGGLGVSKYKGIVSPAYYVCRPTSIADPRFLHYLLRSTPYLTELKRRSKWMPPSQFDIPWENLRDLPITLPERPEQKRIADFLDAETARIDMLDRKWAEQGSLIGEAAVSRAYDAIRGAAFLEERKESGLEWLGSVPASWRVAAVSHLFEVELGKMLNQERTAGTHLRPYLRCANVQWDSVDTRDLLQMNFPPEDQNRYRLREGDLLVCEGGSWPGRAAIWNGTQEMYYQKALHRIRPYGEDSPRWLYYCLYVAEKMHVFAIQGNNSTITHLTREQLRPQRFPFPDIETQHRIVDRLDQATEVDRRLSVLLQRQRDLLAERRRALITAAVTGQFDVSTASGRGVTE